MASSVASSSASSSAFADAEIRAADMDEELIQSAVDSLAQALQTIGSSKRGEIAAYIKKEFDSKYGPSWHCIVGQAFGSYVTHQTKRFVYFSLGKMSCLLFKA